jgi:XTP/dITP diphosphohydrolase
MRVRFLSGNGHKIKEATAILGAVGVQVIPIKIGIAELQTPDVKEIVKDKVAKAFHRVGYPLFVEQTGLSIERMNGFPAGLTQVFWDTLEADRVSQLFGQGSDAGVVARTTIGGRLPRPVPHIECRFWAELADRPALEKALAGV